MRVARALVMLAAAALGLLAVAAPAHAAPLPPGDIAGFTATPAGGVVTSVRVTVNVPTATTSTDCDTPGQFEYALFGVRLSSNTFAQVAATCGNTGNVQYFCDIESAGNLKITVLRPGDVVALLMNHYENSTTIGMARGRIYKQVTGPAPAFASVGIGGWYEPGFDLPRLTTDALMSAISVNGTGLDTQPSVRTALTNGTHIIMRPTPLTSDNSFVVRFLRQD